MVENFSACRSKNASARRYAEGTYISPDGDVFPASYLLKHGDPGRSVWSGVPSQDGMDAGYYGCDPQDAHGYLGSDPGQRMYFGQPDPTVIAVATQMADAFCLQQAGGTLPQGTAMTSHPAYNSVQRSTWLCPDSTIKSSTGLVRCPALMLMPLLALVTPVIACGVRSLELALTAHVFFQVPTSRTAGPPDDSKLPSHLD